MQAWLKERHEDLSSLSNDERLARLAVPLSQRVRSGRTTEIILVNQNQRIMTPLRFPLPDGAAAWVNVHQLTDKSARLAAQGGEGQTTDIDYRGVKVLAAYRHLRIAPGQGWGIIVKQDEAEALEPLYQEIRRHGLLALLSLLVLLGLVTLVARRLAAPISALARTARALESGDLSARSGICRGDEISQLGRTLDAMAEQVQHWHETLSEEVRRRTWQLHRANQLYRTLSETNQAIVHLTARQALFAMVCDVTVKHDLFRAAWITTQDGDVATLEHFRGPNPVPSEEENCLLDGPCGSAGRCLATEVPVIIKDTASDEHRLIAKPPWHAPAGAPTRTSCGPSPIQPWTRWSALMPRGVSNSGTRRRRNCSATAPWKASAERRPSSSPA